MTDEEGGGERWWWLGGGGVERQLGMEGRRDRQIETGVPVNESGQRHNRT